MPPAVQALPNFQGLGEKLLGVVINAEIVEDLAHRLHHRGLNPGLVAQLQLNGLEQLACRGHLFFDDQPRLQLFLELALVLRQRLLALLELLANLHLAALKLLETNLGTLHEADALRNQGVLMALRGDGERGLDFVRRAIESAERSGARLHELRARMSLAEHFPHAAGALRPQFQALYDSFSEGRDEPLLQRAATLLTA